MNDTDNAACTHYVKWLEVSGVIPAMGLVRCTRCEAVLAVGTTSCMSYLLGEIQKLADRPAPPPPPPCRCTCGPAE